MNSNGELQQAPEVSRIVSRISGARAWEKRVFKPRKKINGQVCVSAEYVVKILHAGDRRTVNLRTENLREAGQKAAKFAAILKQQGWAAALHDLAPEQARRVEQNASPSVGDLITAATAGCLHASPATLRQYCSSLRWVVAQVAGLEQSAKRFDGRTGGCQAWREAVDKVKLATITTKGVEAALARYVVGRGATPEAKRTSASFVRQARGLFSARMRRILPFEVVDPFAGLMIERARPEKYLPSFDSTDLVAKARAELKGKDPQAWIALLLCLACGLRKGEADALRWSEVDQVAGVVRVTSGKTADSRGEIAIGPGTMAELLEARGGDGSDYVLAGGAEAAARDTLRTYRAGETFDRLSTWLRAQGVKDKKPIHALRKEAGSIVNATQGIHAASRFLRHADISVTSAHYVDGRRRVHVPLFEEGGK